MKIEWSLILFFSIAFFLIWCFDDDVVSLLCQSKISDECLSLMCIQSDFSVSTLNSFFIYQWINYTFELLVKILITFSILVKIIKFHF